MDHIISIAPDGTVRTLYTDKIDLSEIGPLTVERASSVEYDNGEQGWVVTLHNRDQYNRDAYLSLIGKSYHYASFDRRNAVVFSTREAALAAEVAYLQARL